MHKQSISFAGAQSLRGRSCSPDVLHILAGEETSSGALINATFIQRRYKAPHILDEITQQPAQHRKLALFKHFSRSPGRQGSCPLLEGKRM